MTKVTLTYPVEALSVYDDRLCIWFRRFRGKPDSPRRAPASRHGLFSRHFEESYDFDAIDDAIGFRQVALKVLSEGINRGDGKSFRIVIDGQRTEVPREVTGVLASREAYA